jgi:hypothetical protein
MQKLQDTLKVLVEQLDPSDRVIARFSPEIGEAKVAFVDKVVNPTDTRFSEKLVNLHLVHEGEHGIGTRLLSGTESFPFIGDVTLVHLNDKGEETPRLRLEYCELFHTSFTWEEQLRGEKVVLFGLAFHPRIWFQLS